MSDVWRIEPEPTEEELAALTAVIASMSTNIVSAEAPPQPVSMWKRAARREAIDAGVDDHWDSRF